ncbi:CRTAC1 family protein [Halobacteriovorax sp. RZ-1]|uniref:CRTAC1 family protein n=1 Tax=unclassified Halobacteriovorax TaxID=2639665 RepID=UPI0037159F67
MKYSLLLLSSVILVTSCSSKVFKKKEKKSKAKQVKLNYGPTKSSSKFVDVTKKLGLSGIKASRVYVYDINGDGREDLVFLNGNYSVPQFYLATDEGFVKAKNIYFEDDVQVTFLQFADLDKDGIVDVVTGIHNQKSALTKKPLVSYKGSPSRNNGIVFRKFGETSFDFIAPISNVNLFDYDNDGLLDFFVANWFDRNKEGEAIENRLFTYKKGKVFEISGALTTELDQRGSTYINIAPTFSSSICDINNDGIPDILTSNSAGHPNKLWLSTKRGKNIVYTDAGQSSGYSMDTITSGGRYNGGNSTFAICGDYNNDGYYDIAMGEISHSLDLASRDRSSILTNKGVKKISFIRTEYTNDEAKANWNQGDMRGLWSDLNNDGLIDLIVDNSGFPPHSRLVSFVQENDHELVNRAPDLGIDIVNPSSTVVLDFNDDGRMDILTIQTNTRDFRITPRVYLFENQLPQKNFIKLKLIGKKSNKEAYGAKVIADTDKGNTLTRQHYPSFGQFQPQNSSYIHIGLGDEKVSEVVVEWPYLLENGKKLRKTYPVLMNATTIIKE